MNRKESWDLITKSINDKNSKIIDKLLQKEKKDDVLILGSVKNLNGINENYKPTKAQLKRMIELDDEVVQKYPQNWAFRMQGGQTHSAVGHKIKTGSALFNKNSNIIMGEGAYRMRETKKRFIEGSGTSYDYKYEDPLKVDSESMLYKAMKYIGQKITKPILKKLLGGVKLTDRQQQLVNETMANMKKGKEMKAKLSNEKMEYKDEQMLEQQLNPLDKKEVARRKQLSKLSDKQKMTYMKMQNKKGKENYDKQVKEYAKQGEIDRRYNEERDWRNTQKSDRQEDLDYKAMVKRLAEEKAKEEADKPWYDRLGEEALNLIPEAASLIPVKALQAPAKGLLREGVNQMKGLGDIRPATDWNKKVKAHMKKNNLTLHESSKELAKKRGRPPSAWNVKVKEYMSKHGCSMKEALQALKK